MESKEIWDGFTESLQKEFMVVAIDLPGHGESGLTSGNLTMQLMAEGVKEVFKVENIEKAVLVGHSMGGYVALQFASENENLLRGLVLFHSQAQADTIEAKEYRRRTINIVNQNRGGFIMQFIPDLFDQRHVGEYTVEIQKLQNTALTMSSGAIVAALSAMRDRDNQLQYLSKSKTPVFFIIGKQDIRMPYNLILEQAVIPSHSEVLLLEGVGHMGFIEAKTKTLLALRHFTVKCFE
jgi:pimeloyl-ACP methyl ester carboxylesterase